MSCDITMFYSTDISIIEKIQTPEKEEHFLYLMLHLRNMGTFIARI